VCVRVCIDIESWRNMDEITDEMRFNAMRFNAIWGGYS